jgi:hypothetical protein
MLSSQTLTRELPRPRLRRGRDRATHRWLCCCSCDCTPITAVISACCCLLAAVGFLCAALVAGNAESPVPVAPLLCAAAAVMPRASRCASASATAARCATVLAPCPCVWDPFSTPSVRAATPQLMSGKLTYHVRRRLLPKLLRGRAYCGGGGGSGGSSSDRVPRWVPQCGEWRRRRRGTLAGKRDGGGWRCSGAKQLRLVGGA